MKLLTQCTLKHCDQFCELLMLPQNRARPWEPGWEQASPALGQDLSGPPPQQTDSSGAQKYPPLAPGHTSKFNTNHLVWEGFLAPPCKQSGATCIPMAGIQAFLILNSIQIPHEEGFSARKLLQPPLVLEFSLSAGDTIFLNQN